LFNHAKVAFDARYPVRPGLVPDAHDFLEPPASSAGHRAQPQSGLASAHWLTSEGGTPAVMPLPDNDDVHQLKERIREQSVKLAANRSSGGLHGARRGYASGSGVV